MFCGIGRVVGGDIILEVLNTKEQGWPGDVERVKVFNSAWSINWEGDRDGDAVCKSFHSCSMRLK